MWEMVRDNLSQSSVRCLHFDEFQHVLQTANTLQKIAILNTIKHLLIGEVAAPVGVVLSGLPEIVRLIESDPQMKRRAVRPIRYHGRCASCGRHQSDDLPPGTGSWSPRRRGGRRSSLPGGCAMRRRAKWDRPST